MHIDNLHIIVCNIMNIFSVSPSFCSSNLSTISIMLNVRPQGRKIANATSYFPSFTDGKQRFPDLDNINDINFLPDDAVDFQIVINCASQIISAIIFRVPFGLPSWILDLDRTYWASAFHCFQFLIILIFFFVFDYVC